MKTSPKAILSIAFITLLSSVGFAQTQKLSFGQKLAIGTSVTYITNFAQDVYRYHEWTWSLNAAVNIDHHFMFGLNNLAMLSHGTRVELDRFNLFGAFLQYDFFGKSKNRLYAETGFYKGNYCTCGNKDPYKVARLSYLNIGAGFEWAVRDNLNLEFGLSVYNILNQTDERTYGFTQYVAGVNYVISK